MENPKSRLLRWNEASLEMLHTEKYSPLTDVIFQRHQIHCASIIYFETRIGKFNQTEIGILKRVCSIFKGICVGCITRDNM